MNWAGVGTKQWSTSSIEHKEINDSSLSIIIWHGGYGLGSLFDDRLYTSSLPVMKINKSVGRNLRKKRQNWESSRPHIGRYIFKIC